MEYAFDEEGLCKHRALVAFFKLKAVRDVFRVAYRDSDPAGWLGKGQAIAQYELGGKLPIGIDPQRELGVFAAVFLEVVRGTRSPKENLQAQELEKLRGEVGRSLQAIQTQLQQLPTLEAINQQLSQISGQLSGASSAAQTLALPAAAQNSNAVDLAHRLGEWFEVLDYDRDPDYEEWTTDYFEWVINFPLTRRKFSRTLVRGVAGVVEMADLQDFARAVERTGADEGWLVGNRRVSQATRKAVQADAAYEDISCYTFDELLDEDADFSKYLDWLESEIKAKGVDTEYLPLACRKDELDPTSQRKIGVSVYGEEDGWIDGYVDMWLDDPAKEHLSVLGEFGTGKTWFVLHYAWEALQRYREAKRRGTERPRIPVVVPLRDYAKAVSVESLFSEFFFRKHEVLKNYSVFEKLNRMGKLLLIFDGFDEMADRVNRQAMIDNFWELAKVVVPGAKAILTCRTEHFPNAMEGRQLLSAELESSTAILTGETPQFEVLELNKFEDKQISQLLNRKAQASIVEKVMENEQLLDLARRPVMVDLILEALPEIEAGRPVDMARVYLYAVTRKMENDIKSERTFTSLADKLYFLCELSWEMFSTDRMSLNFRDFPERLKQMFAGRVKEGKDLDHWRYDMMGQTMLIRNSEGDYSPAHRSLLEFFVAYKIVASLGAMTEDFTAIAQSQSSLNESLPSQSCTWNSYFQREFSNDGALVSMAKLDQFVGLTFEELLPLLGQAKLTKAVLDLAYPMLLEGEAMQQMLLPLVWVTRRQCQQEAKYFAGNLLQLMLARNPYALEGKDLSDLEIKGTDFTKAFLKQTNFQRVTFDDVVFSKKIGYINSVTFSPNGAFLAIGEDRGTIQIWDLSTYQVVKLFVGHSVGVRSVVFSPDSTNLASSGNDHTVKIWDWSTGICLQTLKGHSNGVWSVAFSPDGTTLASSSTDHTVKVWDWPTGSCLQTLTNHSDVVFSLAFSSDGTMLASGSYDQTIKIWDWPTSKCLQTLTGHSNSVWSVAFSPDGTMLASGSHDRTLKIWNVSTGACLQTLTGHSDLVWSVAFNPNGNTLASGSTDRTVKIWHLDSGTCIHTLMGYSNLVKSVAFSPDGTILASGSSDGTVKIWNWSKCICLKTLEGHSNGIWSLAFSPDGNTLASGSSDGSLRVQNYLEGTYLQSLSLHFSGIRAVAFSSDGKILASGHADSTVNLWDVATGVHLHTLVGHSDGVLSVAFSSDDTTLASSSVDRVIKIWKVATRE
ncbi:MAG: NACHT domain-containing protein [Cyanobacteria bacterium P01_F01_bin.53]